MTRIEKGHLYPVTIPLSHPYKSATRMTAHSEDIAVKLTTVDSATAWRKTDIITGFEVPGGVVKVPEGPASGWR